MRPLLAFLSVIALGLAPAAGAITMKRSDCANLVRHVTAPDVAYTPGVDASGNQVAPADVDGSIQVEPLAEINIPLSVDLQERFGIPADPSLYEGETIVGTVTYRDHSAFFNGQLLSREDEAALVAACRESLRHRH